MWVFLFYFDLVVQSQRTVKTTQERVCVCVCVVGGGSICGVLVHLEHNQQHHIAADGTLLLLFTCFLQLYLVFLTESHSISKHVYAQSSGVKTSFHHRL